MFEVLLASAPPHVVRPGRLVGSLLTHVLAIGVAVHATRTAAAHVRLVGADAALLTTAPPMPFVLRRPEPEPERRAVRRPVPRREVLDPPPKGFRTVAVPKEMPTIPPVDLSGPPFDPRDYSGYGVEGGVADGVVGGTAGGRYGKSGSGDVVYAATTSDYRFQPAELIFQPEPRYPHAAQAIGLSGRVLLRFVIDTSGRVDAKSIEIVESSADQFAPPARECVVRAVFRPARLAGTPVRQLAEQSVRFVVVN